MATTEIAVCDAAIRPFPNETEVRCDGRHESPAERHAGDVRDYAYPGSLTRLSWDESDRRNFHGAWPGPCTESLDGHRWCRLPAGHHGVHVW